MTRVLKRGHPEGPRSPAANLRRAKPGGFGVGYFEIELQMF